ncbi:MAG: hypothetical protein J6Y94_01790 [Bacteriovoracaceae bacterium]|nr:hypothetical protein [Bacteriovoracaceae bacterium]
MEIGHDAGNLLAQIQSSCGHLELYGLRPFGAALTMGHPGLKAPITTENWSRTLYPPHYFDGIILSQTLEHLLAPLQKMHDILYWLRPQGRIFIFAHHYRSLMNRIFGARSPLYHASRGQIYNPQALNYLMVKQHPCRPIYQKSYISWYPVKQLYLLFAPAFNKFFGPRPSQGMEDIMIPLPAGNFLAVYEGPSLLGG